MEYAAVSSTVHFMFTTNAASGAAVAPSGALGTDDVQIYKDGSGTPRSSTSGWTVTSPVNSKVGLHRVDIDLSDNTDAGFYAAGSKYFVYLTPNETVDSQAVGALIGEFVIGPVVANTIQVGGTAQTARDIGASVLLSVGTGAGQVNLSTGKVPATIAAGDIAASAITASSIAADAIGASELAADAVTEIAAGILDVAASGHNTSGTIGEKINSAASAGDPWSTALPGSYAAGQAGKIVGDNLNAKVGDVKTDTTFVRAHTDQLTYTNASQVDANWITTGSDPTGVPSPVASYGAKVDFMFAHFRNKRTQDGSSEKLFKNDNTTVMATKTKSDNGTTLSVDKAT